MKKLELVFIPLPGFGHITSAIELAKCLLDRDKRLSITVLVIPWPSDPESDAYSQSLAALDTRISYTFLPLPGPPSASIQSSSPMSIEKFVSLNVESHKSQAEQAISELVSDDSVQLVGLVLDLFCTTMIDVGNKFGVPSYLFFPSNTAALGFLLHLPVRHKEVGVEYDPSDPDYIIPSYANPVPANVLHGAAFDKEGGGYEACLYHGTRFMETKGFIINSFAELEPHAVGSIRPPPPVYPVGPLLNLKSQNKPTGSSEIKSWLDNQPPSSVVFLCFGSMGSFYGPQLEQIAIALERTGHRFLWSIRRAPPKDKLEAPCDCEYVNYEEVLPDGFLARTKGRGLLCGWAPQVEVLEHRAVKGFVSHCGWNSILESLWYGVPIATWPLYAEQQMNAFYLVKELGMAVELTLTSRIKGNEVVMADQIERAINSLMDDDNPVREKVKKMSEKSKKALLDGGSSFDSVGKLIKNMLENENK